MVAAVRVPPGIEEGASAFTVSPDGAWAALIGAAGTTLVDLAAGHVDTTLPPGASLAVLRARAGPAEAAWSALLAPPPTVPPGAQWRRSPDGHRLAFFRPGDDTVIVGAADTVLRYALDGAVTGVGWVPRGDLLYLLVLHADGWSALDRLNVETGAVQPMRPALDAPSRGGGVAVSADARTLYLALASDTTPEAAGGPRPDAGRHTDIYALDLKTGRLRRVAATPGDDREPVVVGDALYWTESDPARHDQVLWRMPL